MQNWLNSCSLIHETCAQCAAMYKKAVTERHTRHPHPIPPLCGRMYRLMRGGYPSTKSGPISTGHFAKNCRRGDVQRLGTGQLSSGKKIFHENQAGPRCKRNKYQASPQYPPEGFSRPAGNRPRCHPSDYKARGLDAYSPHRLHWTYSAALSISSLIVHTWSVSLLAIAGVVFFSASCLRPKLYHAMNRACIAVW